MIQRRFFLTGLGFFLTAPAIVRVSSRMPIALTPLFLIGDGLTDDTEAARANARATWRGRR